MKKKTAKLFESVAIVTMSNNTVVVVDGLTKVPEDAKPFVRTCVHAETLSTLDDVKHFESTKSFSDWVQQKFGHAHPGGTRGILGIKSTGDDDQDDS